MATPNQIKKRHKYADKNPQIKKGDIRLNLGENNHIDPKDFDSEDYNRALARSIAKAPFTRASYSFWIEINRKLITIFIEY